MVGGAAAAEVAGPQGSVKTHTQPPAPHHFAKVDRRSWQHFGCDCLLENVDCGAAAAAELAQNTWKSIHKRLLGIPHDGVGDFLSNGELLLLPFAA
jgi:hypothetical protein